MAKLVDATDLKSVSVRVWVRVPLPAPHLEAWNAVFPHLERFAAVALNLLLRLNLALTTESAIGDSRMMKLSVAVLAIVRLLRFA